MFLLKKIVGPLFFPISLCLEVLLAGWVLLCFTRFQRSGKLLVLAGMIMLGLFSYAPFANLLLEPFEYRYPVVSAETLSQFSAAAKPESTKWIAVLGGGHASDPELHPLSQLHLASLARLVEGIRLHREVPASKLLLMGGPVFENIAESHVMAQVAQALGVDRKDIVLEPHSKDTREQAEAARNIIGEAPFLLVTSASHMPRSMALFKKAGTNPIAAPIGHLAKGKGGWMPDRLMLSAQYLYRSERAFYEFLGMTWAWFRGQI